MNTSRTTLRALISRIHVPEAILVGIFPLAGFLLVFVYYSGYFSYFSLPPQLIELDLRHVFVVTSVFLVIALLAILWRDLFLKPSTLFPDPIKRRLRRSAANSLIFFGLMSPLVSPMLLRKSFELMIAVYIAFLAIEFLPPLFTQRSTKGFLAKLSAHERESKERWRRIRTSDSYLTGLDSLVNLLGPEASLLAVLLTATFGFGRVNAISQKNFFILSSSPESVVLYMGSNNAIVAPLDRTGKQVGPGFQIIQIVDQSPLLFSLQDVGPLHLAYSSPSISPIPDNPPAQTPSPMHTATPTPPSRGATSQSPANPPTPSVTPPPL